MLARCAVPEHPSLMPIAPTQAQGLLVYYASPALAMVLLTFSVAGALGALRLLGIRSGRYPMRYFKLMQRPNDANFPPRAEAASRNLINLFEVPVLFYALVPLLIASGERDAVALGCLWAFVALRALHSAIHLTINDLVARFGAFALSCCALAGAWLTLALRIWT
ncbi:MAG TPA: MAPEG family protein [Polyangiaceae bacterium]